MLSLERVKYFHYPEHTRCGMVLLEELLEGISKQRTEVIIGKPNMLYYPKKVRKHKVAHIVAEAYIPNTNNYSDVIHLDENGMNNRVSNLKWIP